MSSAAVSVVIVVPTGSSIQIIFLFAENYITQGRWNPIQKKTTLHLFAEAKTVFVDLAFGSGVARPPSVPRTRERASDGCVIR